MYSRTELLIGKDKLQKIKDAKVNNGRIIEKGDHRELLDRGGFYAELWNSQFES